MGYLYGDPQNSDPYLIPDAQNMTVPPSDELTRMKAMDQETINRISIESLSVMALEVGQLRTATANTRQMLAISSVTVDLGTNPSLAILPSPNTMDTSSNGAKHSCRRLKILKDKRSSGKGGSSSTHSNPTERYQRNIEKTPRHETLLFNQS